MLKLAIKIIIGWFILTIVTPLIIDSLKRQYASQIDKLVTAFIKLLGKVFLFFLRILLRILQIFLIIFFSQFIFLLYLMHKAEWNRVLKFEVIQVYERFFKFILKREYPTVILNKAWVWYKEKLF